MQQIVLGAQNVLQSILNLVVKEKNFKNSDDLWFARSAFIFTHIGLLVAVVYSCFYGLLGSYGASLSLGALAIVLLSTNFLHLKGQSRLLAKINLSATSLGLAGVVVNMGGVDSSAACWMLGVTPGVTALLFRRAREIFQLTIFTLILYSIIFYIEMSGVEVYHFVYPEGSVIERIYTFVHFMAFSIFIAIALAIFATTQRRLLKEVERHSRDVKAILTHIHQGIFTINTSQLTVGEDYSQYLEQIIGSSDVPGRNAVDLVFHKSDLNNEQKNIIETILRNCIQEDPLNFTVNEGNLIRNFCLLDANGQKKMIVVDWQPIINEKRDVIEKILVTMSDVTEKNELEKLNKKQQMEIEIISEIAEISNEKFEQFSKSAVNFLDENARISEGDVGREELRTLFINMHTIKGAARTYHFTYMTAVIHDCEHYYAQVQKKELLWDPSEGARHLALVKLLFNEYMDIYSKKLKRSDHSQSIKIDLETVRQNISHLQSIEGYLFDDRLTPFVDQMKKTFYNLYFIDADQAFSDICKPLASLAKDLGKPTPHISFDLPSFGISRDGFEVLTHVFVHILRNSLDHGIEVPDVRKKMGKSEYGNLQISVRYGQDQALEIIFKDDGIGLQLDKIYQAAVRKQLIDPANCSPKEVAALIFHPGLSTVKAITDISGRGMGMCAVRQFLNQSGGRIDLELDTMSQELNARDFQLIMTLPKHFYTQRSMGPLVKNPVSVAV